MPRTTLAQKAFLILLGVMLCLTILEAGLRLGGFFISSLQEERNRAALSQKNAFRIMCIGESTTAKQYPPFLEAALNQSDIGVKFSVIDRGLAGTNTSIILSRLESDLDVNKPDMVVAMLGINDYSPAVPYANLKSSRPFFTNLRIYKLFSLLWLHLQAKAKEISHGQRQAWLEDLVVARVYAEGGQSITDKEQQAILRGNTHFKQGDLAQAEKMYQQALIYNPKSDVAYALLGLLYRKQNRTMDAIKALEKSIELYPEVDFVHMALGIYYFENLDKLEEAEKCFSAAIKINPNRYEPYYGLGRIYLKQKKMPQAEEMLKKALHLNPKDFDSYQMLGLLYQGEAKYALAEQTFKQALPYAPYPDYFHWMLAKLYKAQGRMQDAQEELKMSRDAKPDGTVYYAEAVELYLWQKQASDAENLLKEGVARYPDNDWFYISLASLYRQTGNLPLAEEYNRKAQALRRTYFIPETVRNYRAIKEILDKRGVVLVCAQYPMRDIAPLKKIFEGEEGIIFVDNQKIFQDAVNQEGYGVYFKDAVGGDFGHCTPKGNRLLAENIAQTIIREVFNEAPRAEARGF